MGHQNYELDQQGYKLAGHLVPDKVLRFSGNYCNTARESEVI
jgi:hypothetical protein